MRTVNSQICILETNDYQSMPWKNGLGTTREIAVSPAAATDFDWRLSIADITADGDFSSFPGYARTISLIEGNGMVLTCDDVARTLDRPFDPFDFDGGAHSHCRLIAGPARDFNIMSARSRCRHEWKLLRSFPFEFGPTSDESAVALVCFRGELTLRFSDSIEAKLRLEETLLAQPLDEALTIDTASSDPVAILVTFVNAG